MYGHGIEVDAFVHRDVIEADGFMLKHVADELEAR